MHNVVFFKLNLFKIIQKFMFIFYEKQAHVPIILEFIYLKNHIELHLVYENLYFFNLKYFYF